MDGVTIHGATVEGGSQHLQKAFQFFRGKGRLRSIVSV